MSKAPHMARRSSAPTAVDQVSEAMQRVKPPRVCSEDHWRLFGTALARAAGYNRLADAFGAQRLWRMVDLALEELPPQDRERFMEWFFGCAIPSGRQVGTYIAGRFGVSTLFIPPLHWTSQATFDEAVRARQKEEAQRHFNTFERSLAHIISTQKSGGRKLWSGGLRIVEGGWDEMIDLALDADWEFIDQASGITMRKLYRKYAYGWNAVKSLLGHCVQRLIRACAHHVGTSSPPAEAARAMREDLKFAWYCAAGAIMAGLSATQEQRNPFLALTWMVDSGLGLIGSVDNNFCVFLPPAHTTV